MNPKQTTVVVFGATGRRGGAVADHLLKGGFRVRAVTRDPDKPDAEDLKARGAEVVRADLEDRASVEKAVAGADGVYSVQTFMEGGVEAEERQGKMLADVAKAAGVKHFVYSSVVAANLKTGVPHFDSKWHVEEHVRKIGLPHTVLRPVFFMENWQAFMADPIKAGTLPQPLDPDRPLLQVATTDIGAFAAKAFTDPGKWLGRAVELAGDELTMSQTAEALGKKLGRPVKYVQVPWDEYEKQAGEEMTVMYRWFNTNRHPADIPMLRREHPGLLTFDQYLQAEDWSQ